jgi:hypothetical protein
MYFLSLLIGAGAPRPRYRDVRLTASGDKATRDGRRRLNALDFLERGRDLRANSALGAMGPDPKGRNVNRITVIVSDRHDFGPATSPQVPVSDRLKAVGDAQINAGRAGRFENCETVVSTIQS